MKRTGSNEQSQSLHKTSGKSVSCDCIKASSCIELADIRKLDSLLNQCESISCDNLLLFDDVYNYDLCATSKRKYVSTSALHRILPKNSIRKRTHKKVLSIRENDNKIIKLIDDKRHRGTDVQNVEPDGELTKCCELNNDKCVEKDVDLLGTYSCSSLTQHLIIKEISCCDKTMQTSYGDLYCHSDNDECKHLPSDEACNNNHIQHTHYKLKKTKRKQCSCRDYENINIICETSLITPPKTIEPLKSQSTSASRSFKSNKKTMLQLKKDKSDEKSESGRSSYFKKQKTSILDDDECDMNENVNGHNSDGCYDRVININDKSIEIFPISLNSSYSQSVTPRGASTNLHYDSNADKSETQSQKSKRSKFSPSFLSRKLTSRRNSEDDDAGGVKESLLGRSKSAEKKLPEPVETVCIYLTK